MEVEKKVKAAETTTRDERTKKLKQTIALLYIAFSALFFISVFFILTHVWVFIILLVFLSVFTVFSVPNLILVLYSTRLSDFFLGSFFTMILMALFYALVAYGLLKKKRVASAIALISSLLTIFADVGYIFWNFQRLNFLGLIVSGIIFNVLLQMMNLSLSPLGHKLRRR